METFSRSILGCVLLSGESVARSALCWKVKRLKGEGQRTGMKRERESKSSVDPCLKEIELNFAYFRRHFGILQRSTRSMKPLKSDERCEVESFFLYISTSMGAGRAQLRGLSSRNDTRWGSSGANQSLVQLLHKPYQITYGLARENDGESRKGSFSRVVNPEGLRNPLRCKGSADFDPSTYLCGGA